MTGMLADPMLDPTGSIIAELRADGDVAALVGTRVRGGEPASGDALGAGSYQAFVVVIGTAGPHPRVPITRAAYTVRCYGSTYQNAAAVWGAVVKAMHAVDARLKGNGLGIYRTWLEQEADQLRDPDTHQPYVEGTLVILATAQAIA